MCMKTQRDPALANECLFYQRTCTHFEKTAVSRQQRMSVFSGVIPLKLHNSLMSQWGVVEVLQPSWCDGTHVHTWKWASCWWERVTPWFCRRKQADVSWCSGYTRMLCRHSPRACHLSWQDNWSFERLIYIICSSWRTSHRWWSLVCHRWIWGFISWDELHLNVQPPADGLKVWSKTQKSLTKKNLCCVWFLISCSLLEIWLTHRAKKLQQSWFWGPALN